MQLLQRVANGLVRALWPLHKMPRHTIRVHCTRTCRCETSATCDKWAEQPQHTITVIECQDVATPPLPPSPPPPPPPPLLMNLGAECWGACGARGGSCGSGFCGSEGLCCRIGYDEDPAECGFGTLGCEGHNPNPNPNPT